MRLTLFRIGHGVNSLVPLSRPLVNVPAATEGSRSHCGSRLGASGGAFCTLLRCRSGRSDWPTHLVEPQAGGELAT